MISKTSCFNTRDARSIGLVAQADKALRQLTQTAAIVRMRYSYGWHAASMVEVSRRWIVQTSMRRCELPHDPISHHAMVTLAAGLSNVLPRIAGTDGAVA